MREVIVVGSGPAGVAAARALRGRDIELIDAGLVAPNERVPDVPLHELRSCADTSRLLLGDRFERVHNVDREYLSPKLTSPLMRFVTAAPSGAPGTNTRGFSAVHSYARGGLANAWGAGVFRYDDRDLNGWPIAAADLAPHYDELTEHIGISGADDDLTADFGSPAGLQPPLRLGALAARFAERYARRRSAYARAGIRVGRLRSAILTRELNGRPPHAVCNHEFFAPNIRSIYHPGYSLDALIADRALTYTPGWIVERFRDIDGGMELTARAIAGGETRSFRARHLVLASGALNSARIVLASCNDRRASLPLLDNQLSYVPLLDVARVGCALDVSGFSGAELALVYDGPLVPERVQASVYGLAAPLKGDLFAELPFSLRDNVAALRYLVPALLMVQVFYPDEPSPANTIRLGDGDTLEIDYLARTYGPLERHIISVCRRAGYASLARLVQYPMPGSSMHYAGTLPMRATPRTPYETDTLGRLACAPRVRVVDGAVFPRLASKNHTFTIMANAARVARHLAEHCD